jgi:hypothetical protein
MEIEELYKMYSLKTLKIYLSNGNKLTNYSLDELYNHLLLLIRDEYLTGDEISLFHVKWVYLLDKWVKGNNLSELRAKRGVDELFKLLDEISETAVENELYEVAHNIKKFKKSWIKN